MPDAAPGGLPRSPADRKGVILDAFEVCIVRSGFHRTTMQDVAREAGMSAGNLYRYFASKEALVQGLTERDRLRMRADFEPIAARQDVIGALTALGRRHYVEEPRERCVQFMEIWAEATRNPVVASICQTMQAEVQKSLIEIFEAGQKSGQVAVEVDVEDVVFVLKTLGDGMYARRGLDPEYDAERGFRCILAVLNALISGRIDLSPYDLGTSPKEPAP